MRKTIPLLIWRPLLLWGGWGLLGMGTAIGQRVGQLVQLKSAEGTVVQVGPTEANAASVRLQVSFTAADRVFYITGVRDAAAAYQAQDPITVYYYPEQPTEALGPSSYAALWLSRELISVAIGIIGLLLTTVQWLRWKIVAQQAEEAPTSD